MDEEYDNYDETCDCDTGDFDDPVDTQGTRTGGNSKKPVTSTNVATSRTAMWSTDELRLFNMNICGPHCRKTCASCQPRWSHLRSPEAEKAHIQDMKNQHGIIKWINPRANNQVVQVDVQNKHMQGILTNVFDGYPHFHASLLPRDSAWSFHEPFDMFVGRWEQLRNYRLGTAWTADKAAWVELVAAMAPVVQPNLDAINRIKDTGLVIWRDLPLIFPPGKLIIVKEPGEVQSVARMQEGEFILNRHSSPNVYSLKFEYIDWDGKKQGLRTRTLDIPGYAGHKTVTVSALKTMPLDFCLSEEEFRTKLVARGRRWNSLIGVEYKQFGGQKVPVTTGVPIEVSLTSISLARRTALAVC